MNIQFSQTNTINVTHKPEPNSILSKVIKEVLQLQLKLNQDLRWAVGGFDIRIC